MNDSTEQVAGYYPGVASDAELASASGLAYVGGYRTRSAVEEHGLVLLSIGQPYWVFTDSDGDAAFQLYVKESVGAHVMQELERYDAEYAAWQTSMRREPIPTRDYRAGVHYAFAYIVALLAGFRIQRSDAAIEERLLSDNFAVFHMHEWWRPLTALFLHADTGHLLNNLTMGLLFGVLCSQSMGASLAWLLILIGGVLGNFLTGWFYLPEAHRSLGASTAVFAAVGLLSGHGGAETLRDRSRRTLFRKAVPLLGGVVLLGWYGFGPNPRTDFAAHLWGFLCGAFLGLLAGTIQIRRSLREQAMLQRPGNDAV